MDASVIEVLQGGGILAFAGVVYLETRLIRQSLAKLVILMTRVEERTALQWTPALGVPTEPLQGSQGSGGPRG